MPRISPFTGLLFDEAVVGDLSAVTAPPYDTVESHLRRRLVESSPHNIVRLDLSETRPGDDAWNNEYTRAASLLGNWRREGALRSTPHPAYYPYEMRFRFDGQGRRIRGLICEVEIEPWGGRIIPHERTMPGPVEDRLRLLRELHVNLSPVYALHFGPRQGLSTALDTLMSEAASHRLADETGVEHRLWMVDEVPGLPQEEALLIADGHHRYTTALRYRDEMRATHGSGPWDRVMMFVVDAVTERPPVLPIHRLLASGDSVPAGERVRDLAELRASLDDEALTYGIIRRTDNVVVHEIAHLRGDPPTVCALHEQVAGLDDASRLRFTHEADEAEEAVRAGKTSAAILLPPTSTERIRSALDTRERMPQKSTFFWPKPRTGMVLRPVG